MRARAQSDEKQNKLKILISLNGLVKLNSYSKRQFLEEE